MQTPEEMTILAIKAKNDPNALLHLWQGCSRYAYKVTTIYQKAAALNGAVDMDDLRQCAFLGFYEAVQGFDHLRGDFLTLLSYGVRKACREALGLRGRQREEHYATVSMETPISEDLTIADTLEDESASTPFTMVEMRQDIEKALHRLPDSIESIIRLHDLEGLTMEQAAETQGYTINTGRNLRRQGFYQLRKDRGLRAYHEPVRLRYKGVRAYNTDWTSVVEAEVIHRLDGWKKHIDNI